MKPWIKTLSAVTFSVAGLSLLVGNAFAQTPTNLADKQQQRVDNRQERQSDRIAQGVASGELTVAERARLKQQQRHINHLEHRTEADGTVTRKEALRVEKAQDRASHAIYRQKHDRQQRGQ